MNAGESLGVGDGVIDGAHRDPILARFERDGNEEPSATCRALYAASLPNAALLKTRLRQYGGPRAGSGSGALVGSPSARRTRAMLLGSVTMASNRMRPLHFGHFNTSKPNALRNSSAHGR